MVVFNFAVGETVLVETTNHEACNRAIIRTPFVVHAVYSIHNTNYYIVRPRSDDGELTFEEEELEPQTEHPPFEYQTTFSVGDVAYVKEKAKKGKLVKVFIKEVRVPTSYGPPFTFIYQDLQNGLWDEDDLVNEDQAFDYLDNYYE